MARLILGKRIVSDLEDIREYIALDSPLNAKLFIKKLRDQFKIIAASPYIGRPRDEFLPGLRSISFGHYIIFYRAVPNEVQIAAVLHGARDIALAMEDHDHPRN